MKEITIYEYQLKDIQEALRLTSRIMNCSKRETSFDRQVVHAKEFVDNALQGNKDKKTKYPY